MKRSNLSKQDKQDCGFLITFFIVLLILVALIDKGCGQEYFKWRWSDQKVMSMPDASGLHCVGSAYLSGTFDNTGKWWKSDLTTITLGTVWEVKDGLIPWERAGVLGGEGFSWGDMQMDLSGIVIHRFGVLIYNRTKYHVWDLNKINKKVKK